ncbi:transport and Golgi organization protein 2 [Elysia marginata]|uniref:Transport and Golgi organization protein 2 n=1 Tax=Elysia marginata TaxID=1093978 RepID=A0AAV4JYT6_9GAST|nr:transport and Golgi organization protein 2 [Elysia marginata]
MCVVYFYQNENFESSGYRLVLAMNRDESWRRPTQTVQFWGTRMDCISGLDMERGKEGGTWLGMNKSGKIGVVLNIPGQGDPSKRGRGFLVSDYLSQDLKMEVYADKILRTRDDYNGFNLILFDVTVSSYYLLSTSSETYGLANSPLEFPFLKVQRGQERFSSIVGKYSDTCTKQSLVDGLMDLMADKTPFHQDAELDKVIAAARLNPAFTACRSAINICCPLEEFGTRTTTVILVDMEGKVDYIEKTVDHLGPVQNEETVHKTFKLSK